MPKFRGTPRLFRHPIAGVLLVVGGGAGVGYIYRQHTHFWKSEHEKSLHPHIFTPFRLISKQAVSSTSSIFTLRPEQSGNKASELVQKAWDTGIWSVEIKQPQLQIARSYTPLPLTDADHSAEDVRLLIRREQAGEVSNYLHNLPEESKIDLRGPHIEFEVPATVTQVLFLAGGTGIAPAMQVAKLLEEREGTDLHILWSNRKREECVGGRDGEEMLTKSNRSWRGLLGLGPATEEPTARELVSHRGPIVEQLDNMKKSSCQLHLDVACFVDEEGEVMRPSTIAHHIQSMEHKWKDDECGNKLILVAGPDGFVENWAGKKVWSGGQQVQGPLGGVLGEMKLGDWKVWKL